MTNWDIVTEAGKHFDNAQQAYQYGFGKDVLYDMCRQTPHHRDIKRTISKLWLIGRSHSAALERSRTRLPGDVYQRTAEAMADGKMLDALLRKARPKRSPYTPKHLSAINEVVSYLAQVFHEQTGLWKISLASKYIHFHEPSLPIYDSIASDAFRRLVPETKIRNEDRWLWDEGNDYPRFLARFSTAYHLLSQRFDVDARNLDVFLLYWNQPDSVLP